MPRNRAITGVLPVALLAVVAITSGLANGSPAGRNQAGLPANADQFVREVIQNEIKEEENGSPIFWRYLEIDKQNGTSKTYDVYETKDGTVRRLIAVDSEPLSPSQNQSENARLKRLLRHPSLAQKAAKESSHDAEQERKLLAMVPDAFLFRYDGKVGRLVRVAFWPNPQFRPQSHEALVFHHMQGFLLLDPDQKRIAEMDGRLTSEVKFMWGILGYLNKGGTFRVVQSDIQGDDWEMTRLYVNMQGKALFFKTVGVQENESFMDYQRNPPEMTLRQAVAQLEKAAPPNQATLR